MASPAAPQTWGHDFEEGRETKRVRLSEPPHHTPTPAPEGEPEVDSDLEPEQDVAHELEHENGHEEPDGAQKKKEKKKRVRTDRDRERDRERRRERDRARRARQAAQREEAKAAAAAGAEASAGPEEVQSEDGEYCICRGAAEGGTMVGCETCDNWFHPACVGLDEAQVDMLDVYICAACEANTTRRTSYRKMCKAGCGKGARSTSKFCSSRCAFAHARTILSNVDKKDAKALGVALTAYPTPAPSITQGDHDRAVLEASQDAATLALLSSLRKQSADAERALAIIARRQAILAAAVGVWESFAPGLVEEPKKRSKNKKRDGEKDPRPCGYDPRLIWSDAEVAAWDGSEREATPPRKDEEGLEGEDRVKETALERAARLGLCAVGRRCERHAGWQKTLAVALEVEATQLSRRRDDLATLGERVERAGTTTVAARRARDGVRAALAAKK